ncbi:MAG: PAS domain S-box protein [Proteobacteria bacterium]|nr:PAS domain S-box protein [Pseudomonadota bacterium]
MDYEKQKLNAILDNLEDGIYVIAQDFTIEFMNLSMVRMFGNGVGKKCYKIINDSNDICPWCTVKGQDRTLNEEEFRQELYIPKIDKTFMVKKISLKNSDCTFSSVFIYRDITYRKQHEAILKASVEDYRNLFEHVGVGVYISTKDGKFMDANQGILDMLGYSGKEEFLKINIITDLYTHPDDRREFQKMIERDGRVIDYEAIFKRKDKSSIPVLMTSHVRYDLNGNIVGYEGIVVDQSHRFEMERRLKEAWDFMNKIIQNSPDAIIAADIKGNIIIWNRAAEDMLGYPASEVIGKMNISKIYPEDMAHKIMKMIRSPEHGGVGMFRSQPVHYVRKDGKTIEGNLSAAMIYDDNGNEATTVGSFVDITERIEMEHTLRDTREQLLQSEKLAAMGRLTSQIAHELNNPLYGIMNTLELLKTEISPENKRRKLLEMSLSEIVRLAEMLRKMLSFSKPEYEEKKPVDVNVIIDEIMMLYEKQFQENSIKIKTEFDNKINKVIASTNQLRQVFLNMVSNAKDAMVDGGTFTVKTFESNGFVNIQFADTGGGILEENMDKIFDSFFTTKPSVKGVGLGLSVCYGFIQDHGGDIKVKSAPGEGAQFTILLPVKQG